MGDLVSSEGAPSVTQLHEVFNQTIASANRGAQQGLVSPLTITLGDEFQGLCDTLAVGLSLLRRLRGRLLEQGVRCRFVLGLVRVETPLNRERAWNMMGPGLAASRERLGDKRDPNAYRFHLPDARSLEALMEAVGAGLTDIEEGWTARQRQVVLGLADHSVAELADQLKISAPTLYKIRRAARFDLYERQWRALEAMAATLDSDYGLPR